MFNLLMSQPRGEARWRRRNTRQLILVPLKSKPLASTVDAGSASAFFLSIFFPFANLTVGGASWVARGARARTAPVEPPPARITSAAVNCAQASLSPKSVCTLPSSRRLASGPAHSMQPATISAKEVMAPPGGLADCCAD